jgi:hypothetical protein
VGDLEPEGAPLGRHQLGGRKGNRVGCLVRAEQVEGEGHVLALGASQPVLPFFQPAALSVTAAAVGLVAWAALALGRRPTSSGGSASRPGCRSRTGRRDQGRTVEGLKQGPPDGGRGQLGMARPQVDGDRGERRARVAQQARPGQSGQGNRVGRGRPHRGVQRAGR